MFDQIESLLRRGRRFVLTTHVNPDGDGVGSQVALGAFLRSLGKDVDLINSTPLTPNLRFLAPDGLVRAWDAERDAPALQRADAILVLDNSAPERLDRMKEPIVSSPATKVCIDHHPDPDSLWDVLVIRESACATGEVVLDLIRHMGGTLTREMATALYTAIVTDTGHFRFSNTRAPTHRIAADLLEAGADPVRVYEEVYEQNSPAYARLLGEALRSFEIEASGRMGVVTLTRQLMRACGAEDEDTSEIINVLLGIGGLKLAVLVKELADGRTKISFRSKGAVDVNALARRFGGGGHRNASGAVLDESMAGVRSRVLDAARELLSRSAAPPAG